MNFPIRESTDSALRIIKDGHEYVLPSEWSLSDAGSYDFNNKIEDRAFSHGGDVVGDGMVKGHTIKVKFSMYGTDEFTHDEMLNRAYRCFAQTDYKLYCGRSDRCFNVASISKITHDYVNGFKQRWSNITVSLLLADPFRYQGQESLVVYDFPAEAYQAEMVLHNLGSVDTPIRFKFTPKSKMASIIVWHEETKKQFKLADALLIAPAFTVINAKEGTVWRNDFNSINTFNGQFLQAVPGKNTLYYTGAAGKIEIIYTNRWFI